VWERWRELPIPEPHPSFTVISGPIAEWEKVVTPDPVRSITGQQEAGT